MAKKKAAKTRRKKRPQVILRNPRKKPPKKAAVTVKKNKRGGFTVGKRPLPLPSQMTIPESPSPETLTMTDIGTERRLSTKIIVGRKIGRIEEVTPLYRILGIVDGLKTGQSTFGEWIALKGQFEALRLTDNTHMKGSSWLPPWQILDTVLAVRSSQGLPVEFAANVVAVPANSDQGFEYEVTYIVEPAHVDLIGRLRSKVDGHV